MKNRLVRAIIIASILTVWLSTAATASAYYYPSCYDYREKTGDRWSPDEIDEYYDLSDCGVNSRCWGDYFDANQQSGSGYRWVSFRSDKWETGTFFPYSAMYLHWWGSLQRR
jgi:hypothetical protein